MSTEDEIKRTPTPLYRTSRSLLNLLGSNPWQPEPPSKTTTTNSSPATAQPGLIDFRVLTYNVWFDAIFKEERTRELMKIVMEESPDVVCFQEATPTFEKTIREDRDWKATWLMTGLTDQLLYTNSGYGTMILVKRSFLKKNGISANAFFVELPGTRTGRCLTVVELSSGLPQVPIVSIGTVHLDYTPELRETHINLSIRALSTSASGSPVKASILCGDSNIENYSELNPLLDSGWVDSWLATHPGSSGDLLLVNPTYGKTGVRMEGKALAKESFARRLDYIMCRELDITGGKVVGDSPIPLNKLKGVEVKDSEGLEVFPSDHMGVLASLKVTIE